MTIPFALRRPLRRCLLRPGNTVTVYEIQELASDAAQLQTSAGAFGHDAGSDSNDSLRVE